MEALWKRTGKTQSRSTIGLVSCKQGRKSEQDDLYADRSLVIERYRPNTRQASFVDDSDVRRHGHSA